MSVPDYNFQDVEENHEDDATNGKTPDSSSILISSSSNGANSNTNENITDDEDISIYSSDTNTNNNNMKSNSTPSSLLKQNIDNDNHHNQHSHINYDERDPLTLEPYSDVVFIFRPQNTTLEIKYNAESLICYYLSSHKLIDPVTSLPLSESDLEELDRLKTILIERSQVNYNNYSSDMEVEQDSMNIGSSCSITTTANIPIQYSNNNNNVNNTDIENSSNGSSYDSSMAIGSAVSFKSYFEQEEFKSTKAMEREKNCQILNLETMLGEIASTLLDVIETNRINENNEIEVSMYCSQYDCLFQQLKEIDLEKAYQMLKSSEAFLKGPKKKPTPANALFQSVRQFLLTLWNENDEKSLEVYRDQAAARSRSGSIDSGYGGGFAFGSSPGSFGSSLATSLTTTPSLTTTSSSSSSSSSSTTTNTSTSHCLDINARNNSQDSYNSSVSMLSSSVMSFDNSSGGVDVVALSNNNGNHSELSSLHVIFENTDDVDNGEVSENDGSTSNTTTAISTTNHHNSSIVQGNTLLLLPPPNNDTHIIRSSLPPVPPLAAGHDNCNAIIAYNRSNNEEHSVCYTSECDEEDAEEEAGQQMDSEDEEEAFFGAFSV